MAVTKENAMQFLREIADTLSPNRRALVMPVLDDPLFAVAPGSSKYHHDYLGGLAHHTAEVVENVVGLIGECSLDHHHADHHPPFVNRDVVLVAAFNHDWMKTLEYEYELETFCPECPCDPLVHGDQSQMQQRIKQGSIKRSEWGQRISHVVGSVLAFQETVRDVSRYSGTGNVAESFVYAVTHCMLAHHGRYEWRSPIEPKSPEAWILHSADMLSAQP